jgi:carboxyl-terminal processing protease
MVFAIAAWDCSGTARADGPAKPPPDLARRVLEVTDVVLEHHIDPPARQQMILSGIKALDQAAGAPVPAGLSRRVSAVMTREQLAARLADAWPKTSANPVAVDQLEEALFSGMLESVPGRADLVPARDRAVNEQFAGNRYVGIHIALGMDDQEKRPKLFDVLEGGPADRAGAKKDDLIEQIDGVDTKNMTLRQALDRLRGAEGTKVTILVRQPQEKQSRSMTLTRGQLPRTTVKGVRKRSSGGWDVRLEGADAVGYLRITEMTASTPHELRKMARQLESEGVRSLVIDLRGPLHGNAIHPAVLLADALLDRGPIGRVRTTQGEETYQADPDALFRGWPMAVLVDSTTSGTAEWVAAALQDNRRAVVVGMPTSSSRSVPGDAVVTSTVPFGDGTWLATLVTGCLERADGRPLSFFGRSQVLRLPASARTQVGVHPDHVILDYPQEAMKPPSPGQPVSAKRVEPSEPRVGSDPVLRRAVEVLQDSRRKV